MKTNLYEDLESVSKIRSRKEKIARLQQLRKQNDSIVLFLHYVYDKRISWLIIEGFPETYKECQDSPATMFHRLRGEIRKLNRFVSNGQYPTLDQKKRNELFQTVLETVHPEDAKLLMFAKENRVLPFTNITIDLLEEAFPKETFESKKDA